MGMGLKRRAIPSFPGTANAPGQLSGYKASPPVCLFVIGVCACYDGYNLFKIGGFPAMKYVSNRFLFVEHTN